MPGSCNLRSSWIVAGALCILTVPAAAQDSIQRRVRSSVILRAPSAVAQTAVTRPSAALPPAAAPIDGNEPAMSTLVRAARARQPEPAGVTELQSAESAATSLAMSLYGSKAQIPSLTLLSRNTATVWVGDSPVKEKAPPGLDVEEGVVLPFRYISVDEETGEVMALKPWFDDGGGLRYDSRARAYVATLRIGLRDTLSTATSRRVIEPAIHLSIGAAADSIDPERLEIRETNVFTSRSRLVTTRVGGPMRVTVWPDFAPEGVELWIPVVPDSIYLIGAPSINGFGLGETRLTVALSQGAIAPGDSLPVTLRSALGAEFIGGPVVWPKVDAPAEVVVRSSGVGKDVISAYAGPLIAIDHDIRFTFPYGLVLGGLLGALMGSALSVMRERKRVVRKSLGIFFASGALTGLVIALIVAVGVIRIPGFELASGGAALVSLLAGVLGGYIGPKGLERIVPSFASARPAKRES